MTINRQEILDQIASIKKLSTDPGAFQGEISNAAALISKLMTKYSITEDEVDEVISKDAAKQVPVFEARATDYRVKGLTSWHWSLAQLIAHITHTRYYFTTYKRQGTARFFGDKPNVDMATSLFAEWIQIIMAMCKSANDDHWQVLIKKYDYFGFLKRKKAGLEYGTFMENCVPQNERTTHFNESWYAGCLSGMWSAVHAADREQDKKTTSAVQVYKEELDRQYDEFSAKFKKVSIKAMTASSSVAYEQGYETGKTINLGLKRIK